MIVKRDWWQNAIAILRKEESGLYPGSSSIGWRPEIGRAVRREGLAARGKRKALRFTPPRSQLCRSASICRLADLKAPTVQVMLRCRCGCRRRARIFDHRRCRPARLSYRRMRSARSCQLQLAFDRCTLPRPAVEAARSVAPRPSAFLSILRESPTELTPSQGRA